MNYKYICKFCNKVFEGCEKYVFHVQNYGTEKKFRYYKSKEKYFI